MNRENNYDLLRILGTIAVIAVHVHGTWYINAVRDISEIGLHIEDIHALFLLCLYNATTRFSVPCFIMLSGAFILDNKKNMEYKYFYSKSFRKIGVPTIIFSALYILYRLPGCFLGEDRGIGTLLADIIKGSPMYHMWYLYMLIGVYMMAPIVLRFKESISANTFYKFSFVFLIWASISRWTDGDVSLNWNLGQSFEYLGYFAAGYSIRKLIKEKNNFKAICLILSGILVEICVAGFEYKVMTYGIAERELKYRIVSWYCPLIVLISLLTFAGFTSLEVKKEFGRAAETMFFIYLIHAGVWDFISKMFSIVGGQNALTDLDCIVWIPLFIIIVFVISCLLSKIYIWLWNKLDKGDRITNYLVRLVGL